MVKFGAVPNRGRSRLFLVALVATVFLLSGCDRLKQIARQPELVKKQQKEITRLDTKIRGLEIQLAGVQQKLQSQHTDFEQRLATLDSSLNSLGTRYAVLDSDVNKHRKCVFQKNSKEVQRLDTDMGPLLVSLDGIETKNGKYTLSLNIGNPAMSEISAFTLHVKYGKEFTPSGSQSYEDWENSLKSVVQPFKEDLKPGMWNTVAVPLGKLQPEESQYITVQMMVDNIKLKKQ
ncbi:MAG: hypothetical protein ACP5SH_02200 [Syntrophobacteraceae bacterium]